MLADVDAHEARLLGESAVRHAATVGASGSVAIRRLADRPYACECFIAPLAAVAHGGIRLKDAFINAEGNGVTAAWLDHVAPLVGELPRMEKL